MAKLAYFDCSTGIAGDMCLGALVDLGVPIAYLTDWLDRLGIPGEYRLTSQTVLRNGQRATQVAVILPTAAPDLVPEAGPSKTTAAQPVAAPVSAPAPIAPPAVASPPASTGPSRSSGAIDPRSNPSSAQSSAPRPTDPQTTEALEAALEPYHSSSSAQPYNQPRSVDSAYNYAAYRAGSTSGSLLGRDRSSAPRQPQQRPTKDQGASQTLNQVLVGFSSSPPAQGNPADPSHSQASTGHPLPPDSNTSPYLAFGGLKSDDFHNTDDRHGDRDHQQVRTTSAQQQSPHAMGDHPHNGQPAGHDHDHGHNHSHSHSHSHSHDHGHNHSHNQDHHHDHDHHYHGQKHLSSESPAVNSGVQGHGSSHEHDHHHDHNHGHGRYWPEIVRMIRSAHLPERAERWSLAIFQELAIAEGAVHGIAPEQVHFHEVGAIDAIVDIVGTCLGLDWLGIDRVYCSALPTGGGTVRAAHGRLPVPVPAVLQLCAKRRVPLFHNGIDRELVTPTGAAIVTALASAFGPPPALTLHQVGLGAGTQELALPNILRLWLGEAEDHPASSTKAADVSTNQPFGQTTIAPTSTSTTSTSTASTSTSTPTNRSIASSPSIAVSAMCSSSTAPARPDSPASSDLEMIALLESQVDDLSPQVIAYTIDRLFAAGALDVFTQAVTMKKSRLGTLISVICPLDLQEVCEAILFSETTTLGIRRSHQERRILDRRLDEVKTPYGPVRVKVAGYGADRDRHDDSIGLSQSIVRPIDQLLNAQPEYEDVAALARYWDQPFLAIHQSALTTWQAQSQT